MPDKLPTKFVDLDLTEASLAVEQSRGGHLSLEELAQDLKDRRIISPEGCNALIANPERVATLKEVQELPQAERQNLFAKVLRTF